MIEKRCSSWIPLDPFLVPAALTQCLSLQGDAVQVPLLDAMKLWQLKGSSISQGKKFKALNLKAFSCL